MPDNDTSLRDALSTAYEGAGGSAAPAPAPAPEAASPPPAEAPAPAESKTTEAAAATDAATAAAALAAGRPIPERLKSKWADKWETLDQAIRDEFHSYESHIGGLASRYGKAAKAWERAQQTFAPYAEMVQREGGDFHTAMGNLFETARILRTGAPAQKVALVQAMAQSFNISPQDIVRALGGQIAGGEVSAPAPTPAPGQDVELLNRLSAIERRILTQEGQALHNVRTQVTSETSAFLADPANAYVQEPGFTDTMAQLLESGAADNLQDAYQKATWIIPTTREMELAKSSKQRMEAERQRAERAKHAAVSLPGNAPGSMQRDLSKLDLRQTLAAAFDGELS